MTITLSPDLEAAVNDMARRHGVSPEELAIRVLREHIHTGTSPVQPQDEWERRLLSAATDCGVSLPDKALTREAMYD
jgi:hypothetical protein